MRYCNTFPKISAPDNHLRSEVVPTVSTVETAASGAVIWKALNTTEISRGIIPLKLLALEARKDPTEKANEPKDRLPIGKHLPPIADVIHPKARDKYRTALKVPTTVHGIN